MQYMMFVHESTPHVYQKFSTEQHACQFNVSRTSLSIMAWTSVGTGIHKHNTGQGKNPFHAWACKKLSRFWRWRWQLDAAPKHACPSDLAVILRVILYWC
jgi:hypothetical protein